MKSKLFGIFAVAIFAGNSFAASADGATEPPLGPKDPVRLIQKNTVIQVIKDVRVKPREKLAFLGGPSEDVRWGCFFRTAHWSQSERVIKAGTRYSVTAVGGWPELKIYLDGTEVTSIDCDGGSLANPSIAKFTKTVQEYLVMTLDTSGPETIR